MPSSEPDSTTIDAWLAGELSDEKATAVEQYFHEHPETLPLPDHGGLPDRELLVKLADVGTDPKITDFINRIKTSRLEIESAAPSKIAWREVLTPSDDAKLLGTIENYNVLELIATGGMGIVFKARDPKLNRIAALKVLSPDLAANATARERFLREARAAANLEHENILPIYGVHDDGLPYFAMRYGSGGTLQDRLDAGEKFSIDQLKSIARQVASALGAAHRQGLVHRDIKPANILFEEDGERLWVCDFGIARSTEDPSLTYPGAIAGTPQFMSPEQAAGAELDGRSDLFSLGAVLHRCATGSHAFSGETTAAVLRQLGSNQTTTIAAPQANMPNWFRRLLMNLLAKDPRDRPGNAAVVVRAIDDEHSPRPKHSARRNRRVAVGAVSMVTSGALSFALLQIPAVERAANRGLGARYDQPFTLEGRLGAWSSLARAAAAAHDGETIELPAGEPIAVDNLQLPPGKSLSLVSADPPKRPVLTTVIAGAPGIVSRSPLRLVGLDFQLNPKRDTDGIVVVIDGALELEDCRFTIRREGPDPSDDFKSRALELRGDASAVITECHFELEETNAITVRGGSATVTIRDSRIAAPYAVDLHEFESAEKQVTIDAAGSRFAGQSFLKAGSRGSIPGIDCAVADCEFVNARTLGWFQTDDITAVRRQLRWGGEGNIHTLGNEHVQVGTGILMREAKALLPIAAFSDPPSDGVRGTIEIEETGEQFTDLKAAFDRAPTEATFLLSGRIVCREEVIAPSGKVYHLRPAPGATPTVVAYHPRHHAIFITGEATVSGIRFVRPDAPYPCLPVLGIKGNGSEVLIEDCIFDAGPTVPDGSEAGVGLGLTDVGSATVRRCIFRTGRGLYAAFVDGIHPADIHLEECLFTGHTAIEYVSRIANTEMTVTAERCAVICENLLSKPPSLNLHPLKLNFSDCLLDVRESLFRFPETPFETVRAHLSWNGRNNHYRRGAAGLYPLSADADPSAVLNNLEAFFVAYPEFEDSGGRFGTPFDRTRLRPPITPGAVRVALEPAIESPAVETLDWFVRPADFLTR